jgi:type IX secretion system PorP/SprF family membrane protein
MAINKYFLSLTFVFSILTAQAQDIHFSQFYASPLNLNPALTGVMNCNGRLSLNYRDQWSSVLRDKAFSTYNLSYDGKIPVGRYDYIGLGGTVWGDKAGSLGFKTTQAKLSFSYAKKMGGYRKSAQYLVLGADVSGSQRGIDFTDARWGSQNDGGVFNPNIASFETRFSRTSFWVPDVTAGLMWFSVIDENSNYYIGGAYGHINRANQSFTPDINVPIFSKFTIHAGGEFEITNGLSLLPGAVVLLQGPSMEMNFGSNVKFKLGSSRQDNEALQFGAWLRLSNKLESGTHADALIFCSRFDYNEFSLGLSYDVNTSALSTASHSNGGFEFSLVYKLCGKESRDLYCPNF